MINVNAYSPPRYVSSPRLTQPNFGDPKWIVINAMDPNKTPLNSHNSTNFEHAIGQMTSFRYIPDYQNLRVTDINGEATQDNAIVGDSFYVCLDDNGVPIWLPSKDKRHLEIIHKLQYREIITGKEAYKRFVVNYK